MLFIKYLIIFCFPAMPLDIDKPLWDLNTFIGRWKHFAWVTDPRTCITSEEELDKAKILIQQYR